MRPRLRSALLRTAGPLAGLLAAAGLFACDSGSKHVLRDTEGRKVEATCNEEGKCALNKLSGPDWGDDRTRLTLRDEGLLVALCNSKEGAEPDVRDCRPLECDSDGDCPARHANMTHGTCANGLCIEPSHGVGKDDAVMLCLSGTGTGHESPDQVERYALALNCGDPCRVPKPCRQP